MTDTYMLGQDSIMCLVCGAESYHPEDVQDKFCPNCNKSHQQLAERLELLQRAITTVGGVTVDKDAVDAIKYDLLEQVQITALQQWAKDMLAAGFLARMEGKSKSSCTGAGLNHVCCERWRACHDMWAKRLFSIGWDQADLNVAIKEGKI